MFSGRLFILSSQLSQLIPQGIHETDMIKDGRNFLVFPNFEGTAFSQLCDPSSSFLRRFISPCCSEAVLTSSWIQMAAMIAVFSQIHHRLEHCLTTIQSYLLIYLDSTHSFRRKNLPPVSHGSKYLQGCGLSDWIIKNPLRGLIPVSKCLWIPQSSSQIATYTYTATVAAPTALPHLSFLKE